ncbi:MAG: type VI secretion system lipoprotein TssJ [Candidatus Electrothrix sp. GW3-4]|uniref:type VI secretion system lipoprotein TssJ n=1 Tax=Candidatus Electrothrix sp. GW3-4 TaxID=3126740 RepID=UPI0030D4DFCB
MKKNSLFFVLLFLLFFSGCAERLPEQPTGPEWTYEKDAVSLRIKADPLLNVIDGEPHTLMLCLYQLRDKSMFEQLSGNEDGIYQLLDCEAFDSSVNMAKRLIVHPGQDMTIVTDRLAGTQHQGIVAGYYTLQKERMIRAIDISTILSQEENAYLVDRLNLVVNLGSEQIAAIRKN